MKVFGHILLFLGAMRTWGSEMDVESDGLQQIFDMIDYILNQHLYKCHILFITSTPESSLLSPISRKVNTGIVLTSGAVWQHDITQSLWGDNRTTYRLLIIHINSKNNTTNTIIRLLEDAGLWKLPETYVVIVGGRSEMEMILLHPFLRNTKHVIYFVIQSYTSPLTHSTIAPKRVGGMKQVRIYGRCLYCNQGQPTITFLGQPKNNSQINLYKLFLDKQIDMMGKSVRIVSVPFFPLMAYKKNNDQNNTLVTPLDSVDTRLLITLAKKFNFIYTVNEPRDKRVGSETNGSYNGLLGELERQEADFSTLLGFTSDRLRVVDFVRVHPPDELTVVSLKPMPLPQQLALIRPFGGIVWAGVFVGVLVWGMTLWMLQRVWWWITAKPYIGFVTTLLYAWGTLLEKPPSVPSINASGQVLVGFWLLFCLIVSAGFKSSLISHLTVQGKTEPMETLAGLVEANGWRWAIEPWMTRTLPGIYFKKHTDPVVMEINRRKEVYDLDTGLKEVLKGKFAMILARIQMEFMIPSRYTDSRGRTPYHISKKSFPIVPSFGWGFRKGAPYQGSFRHLIHQLEDAGIISRWTKEIIQGRVTQNRANAKKDIELPASIDYMEGSREIKLSLDHLQGAFYVIFLGYTLAAIIFFIEALLYVTKI